MGLYHLSRYDTGSQSPARGETFRSNGSITKIVPPSSTFGRLPLVSPSWQSRSPGTHSLHRCEVGINGLDLRIPLP